MKIALIREYKQPADERVALSPKQAAQVMKDFPNVEVVAESSPERCYTDEDYKAVGVNVQEDVSDADILLGVKEVPIKNLIPNKTYLFFSHTIKKQPYNKEMLQEIIKRNIKLVDYECLEWKEGGRVLGFGHFAGIVGAYNGLLTWGKKFTRYNLTPAHELKTYEALKEHLNTIDFPPMKIAICGDGRVGHGSVELLKNAGIKQVNREEYLKGVFNEPVFVHLSPKDFYARKDGSKWSREHFFVHPEEYKGTFDQYTPVTDLMINAIYWEEKIPVYFTKEDMKTPDFRIKVIADITCDVEGSIPCTLRPTPIEDPVIGWDSYAFKEVEPYLGNSVDIMAVTNLPCELPADASQEFGSSMVNHIMPLLIGGDKDDIIKRATIAEGGKLTEHYSYLEDYIA
ncbi:MAG: NAD(P)-dependent oxidoreductase [bacterium]